MADTLHSLIKRLHPADDAKRLDDAELLARFIRTHDAAAFEVLVWRHGAMVLGAARRLLGNEADAEDAFQATFLTLARKAGSIRRGGALAAWLHLVACRVAGRQRRQRRPMRSLNGCDVATTPLPADDLGGVLDCEIARLPERFRRVVVLCYLEGRSAEEAAAVLGCPRGTVLSRLANARRRLRPRLERRGIALAVPPVIPPLSERLVTMTVPLGQGAAATAPIITLSDGVIRTMFRNKLRLPLAAGILVAAGLVAIGFSRADKPAGQPADLPPAAKGEDAEAVKLRMLLLQRRDNLQDFVRTLDTRQDLQTKAGALEQMIWGRQALMEVELELSREASERVQALDRALKSAQALHTQTRNRVRGGLDDPQDELRARDAVLKIEVALQKERMKSKK